MSEVAQQYSPAWEYGLDSTPALETAAPLLEIRMLGQFQVRRRDGSIVDPGEWRTGKAADLVRILALQAGDSVPAPTLVENLWPGSDERRGRASLRTATFHVRQALGCKGLERSSAGLRLCDAWVDVKAFRTMADDAHRLLSSGRLSQANAIAQRAVFLYRGNLQAYNNTSPWVQAERQALAGAYQTLLCEAAEAAVTLDSARDAIDFAGRALAIDPFSERASRLLMRGHAQMGEIPLALREFQRCRTLLADDLGIEPSPQTLELHRLLFDSVQPAPHGPATS